MNQRFTVDRQSFEQFIAAVSLFQSLQHSAAMKSREENLPLLLLETLRAIDSGEFALQAALERVVGLALHIVGGDGAILWLFTTENLICRAAAGKNSDDDRIRTALRSKLQSAGAFGEDPPPKLDLTRTLEKYSAFLGSSLAIAILPGGKIAGALAVFSNQSTTFNERNYANLRLLAGLAQYVLTKKAAGQALQDSPDDSREKNPATSAIPKIHATTSSDRSARAPLISHAPSPDQIPQRQIERRDLPEVGTRVALGGGMNERPQIETGLHSLFASPAQECVPQNSFSSTPVEPAVRKSSPGGAFELSPALQRWEEWTKRFKSRRGDRVLAATQAMRRLKATALDDARNILRRVRNVDVHVNWIALAQAVPAFAILAVMSFFVGLLTGGRQPLADSPLNATAQAATTPVANNSANNANQETATILIPKRPAPVPTETSHLQITDRATAATIAELSKYEVRTLRRAADYGDDQAALQLGMLYELGRGFPQSCSKAAQWVTKAAANGNAAAEHNLGLRYRDGDGVEANLQQAETWLRKAAAHKNSNAQRVLTELQSQSPEASDGKPSRTSPSRPDAVTPASQLAERFRF